MGLISIKDATKAYDFLKDLESKINNLSAEVKSKSERQLVLDTVYPRIVKHLSDLCDTDTLMVRDSKASMHIRVGKHIIEAEGFVWNGWFTYEYPYKREIAELDRVLESNTKEIAIPKFLEIISRDVSYNRRRSAKVLLLNFPELKPVCLIKCKIPSITVSNWCRSRVLEPYTRDQVKEMQDELQSVLSLVLL